MTCWKILHRVCLHPNCLIHAFRYSSQGINLAMHILGEFSKGLVVFCAAVHIILICPHELFAIKIWLAQVIWPNQVTPGWDVIPNEVYFSWNIQLYSQIFCIWHSNALLATMAHLATFCLLAQTCIDTLQYKGKPIGKGT